MRELDQRARRARGGEANVDPARVLRIEVLLEVAVEVPRKREEVRRVDLQDRAGVALGAVDAALEPATTDTRLDREHGRIGFPDMVRSRPPRVEAVDEHVERALDGRVDRDRLANGGGVRVHGGA